MWRQIWTFSIISALKVPTYMSTNEVSTWLMLNLYPWNQQNILYFFLGHLVQYCNNYIMIEMHDGCQYSPTDIYSNKHTSSFCMSSLFPKILSLALGNPWLLGLCYQYGTFWCNSTSAKLAKSGFNTEQFTWFWCVMSRLSSTLHHAIDHYICGTRENIRRKFCKTN